MGEIIGLPTPGKNPTYDIKFLKIYAPKLNDWIANANNKEQLELFIELCSEKLNISFWGNDWNQAMSYAIAHYIVTTQQSSLQSIGSDAMAGGVQSSRTVGDISFSYDTDATLLKNPAYAMWNQSGYGRYLVTMSVARGYVGMIIVT